MKILISGRYHLLDLIKRLVVHVFSSMCVNVIQIRTNLINLPEVTVQPMLAWKTVHSTEIKMMINLRFSQGRTPTGNAQVMKCKFILLVLQQLVPFCYITRHEYLSETVTRSFLSLR